MPGVSEELHAAPHGIHTHILSFQKFPTTRRNGATHKVLGAGLAQSVSREFGKSYAVRPGIKFFLNKRPIDQTNSNGEEPHLEEIYTRQAIQLQ
jgi:hypothetical protein